VRRQALAAAPKANACPLALKEKLTAYLSSAALPRKAVRIFRLYKAANLYLHLFPVVKKLPSGVTYRARWVESLPLSRQMLELGTMYPRSKLPTNVERFVDLGCNVGYFGCWLAEVSEARPLKGLMIDANKEAIKEAEWHARINRWDDVCAIHGLAGERSASGQADFFLYWSNYCSSTTRNPSLHGSWKRIRVPCIDVGALWHKKFGTARCDLLKVDIEGSEMDFFRNEQAFLRQVEVILLEWHKWRVKLSEVEAQLLTSGFKLSEILEEGELDGTCLFRRVA
jgi:FkbM family methyltransferase